MYCVFKISHGSQKQVFSPKGDFSVTEALYVNGIFKYE